MIEKFVLLALIWNGAALGSEMSQRFTGILRTGVMAIGGETTGTVLEMKDGKLELVLGKDISATKIAEFSGKRVVVHGVPFTKPGVEMGERKLLRVETIAAE